MRFHETRLSGVKLVDIEPIEDNRGFFTRTWCEQELKDHGIDSTLSQCNVSYNHKSGTLRGMHFQSPPHGEAKLVRCTRGKIFDVVVDVRPGSDTFGQWDSFKLDAASMQSIFIPQGFAHGFQTLSDDCEIFYMMSTPFQANSNHGFLWNDPDVGIEWPQPDQLIISDKDQQLPLLKDCQHWL